MPSAAYLGGSYVLRDEAITGIRRRLRRPGTSVDHDAGLLEAPFKFRANRSLSKACDIADIGAGEVSRARPR